MSLISTFKTLQQAIAAEIQVPLPFTGACTSASSFQSQISQTAHYASVDLVLILAILNSFWIFGYLSPSAGVNIPTKLSDASCKWYVFSIGPKTTEETEQNYALFATRIQILHIHNLFLSLMVNSMVVEEGKKRIFPHLD